jgi:serine protease inhibitor
LGGEDHKKKIITIIDSIDFDVLLVSAIHFKSDWKFKFDPKQTVQMNFTGSNNSPV